MRMTFFNKIKIVLDHYHIPYEEDKYQISFRLKGNNYTVTSEDKYYQVVKSQPNCIYQEEWTFKSSQFNDFADIFLEDIDD